MKAKKIVALLLAVAMTGSLVACGGTATTATTETTAAETGSEEAEAEGTTAAETDADADEYAELLEEIIPGWKGSEIHR